jgi:hypothetical protein
MKNKMELLDVVALTVDLPDMGVYSGQVGTIVEYLAPGVYEVESSDNDGQTYAMLPLREDQVLLLKHEPVIAV